MSASNFNLRGIPYEVLVSLKQEAKRLRMSVNALILQMIEQGLGFSCKRSIHHDLDHLAGTWSSTEAAQFEENIRDFDQIDKELWK